MTATRLVLARISEGSQLRSRDLERARLVERAAERGVLPIVYRFLKATGEPLPRSASEYWRQHLARLALYRAELGRVIDVLSPLAPIVVLKGEPLAWLLYSDGTMRNTTDMDLLILPQAVDTAVEALADLGYQPAHGARSKTWTYNQIALSHHTYGTIIELHWRIAFPHTDSPPIGDLLAETRSIAVGDRHFETLRPELLFLQLGYHFHQHLGFLKGLLDIAGWIDRFEDSADLDEIRDWQDRLGIGGIVQWPLHVLDRFAGYRSRLYDPGADRIARAWAAWTCAQFERDFIELRPHSGLSRWLQAQSFGAKVAGAALQALSMTVVDGPARKLRSAISPLILGPHRLGRAVFGGLERLGVVDRDQLFERRILG